ncbi:polyphosphate--glucose phosphotransferase [Deinococcus maricopensis]|uniref:Polyphosphate--glucose phosphotransferase n=1 Tax=Deinococcus maricopensis (strain DSM 21211 / LMG 22137 / NRRL B-23946 / LB-34) TaxID=709986 RepID=E8UBJ7_DEIML|nr:ROK family protein [Deinococcus maricopensis]ADV68436.1 Polyphosphate--glucose phosphotransferase [Deinococcus maricopensis DSM 21211]
MTDPQQILGIDIGGSGIKGAPVDVTTGQLLAERHRIPTPEGADPDDVARVITEIQRHFGWDGPVGCTFPGVVRRGTTLTAANVSKDWVGLDAAKLLADATGTPVQVLNDADAAGLAEARFGAGKDVTGVVILLTFGTGIGSAVIQHGTLLPNTEFGHMEFNGHEAEAWASDRARERDELGWKAWAKRAGAFMGYLEMLFSPDLFIVGGGVSKKADKWQDHLDLRTPVQPATLKNAAGIVGAALHAHEHTR